MKKAGFVLFIAVLILLGTGCATAGRDEFLSEPIALVAVVSNWDINWKGEEAVNPNLFGAPTRRALRADPDLALKTNADELIVTAERIFRDTVTSMSGGLVMLADRDKVISSRAYQNAEIDSRRMNRQHSIPPDHRLIGPRNRNFPQDFANETGIHRVMFVDFTFTKEMRSGFGKTGQCGVNVEMRVQVLDNGGRRMYQRTFDVRGRGTIGVSGGLYSRSELLTLFESAISDAVFDFLDHLEDLL